METGPMNLAHLNPVPRLGPRPLALHLANASLSWLSSQAALPLLKNGSLPWKPELAQGARDLLQSLGDARPEEFGPALERELRRRADLFLKGIEPYRRHVEDTPLLWQEGTTKLFDYAPSGGDPVLVVPSLINRGYILDLAPGNSLLRFLAGQGLRPFLVDWDAPAEVERAYGLSDYITLRLEKAAEAASQASGGKSISVLGYCMGGLLALALADRRPDLVNSLALLATPWKFHAERPDQARLLGALAAPFA